MFDKSWFLKHQKLLLRFANSFIGRYILCLKTSSVGSNKIIRILPNSITWKEGKYLKTEFRTHDKFAKRIYYAFYPLWKLFHLWDMAWYPNFNLGFDTFYPDANPETTSVDGMTYRNLVDESFATIRAGAGVGVSDADTSLACPRLQASTTSNQYSSNRRSVFLFDTSALPDGAVISTTTLSISGSAKTTGLGSPAYHIGGQTTVANTSLANSDYENRGTTTFGNIANASWAIDGSYNDVSLNASGIAAVNKTGISKFSGQVSWDILNDTTGLSWASAGTSGFTCYFADQTGTGNDPKLVVIYGTTYQETYIDVVTIAEVISKSDTRVLSDTITIMESTTRSIAKIILDSITLVEVTVREMFLSYIGRIPTYIKAMVSSKPTGVAVDKDKPGIGEARSVDKPDKF